MNSSLSYLPSNKPVRLRRVVDVLRPSSVAAMATKGGGRLKMDRIVEAVLHDPSAGDDWVHGAVGCCCSDFDIPTVADHQDLALWRTAPSAS